MSVATKESTTEDARFRASWAVFVCAMAIVVSIGLAGVVLVAAFWGPWIVGTGLALIGLAVAAGWLIAQVAPRRGPLLVVDPTGIRAPALDRFVPWQSMRSIRPRIGLGGLSIEVGRDAEPGTGLRQAPTLLTLGNLNGSPRAIARALKRFAPVGVAVEPPYHGWMHRLPTMALWVWVFVCFSLAALSEGGGSMAAMHNLIGNVLYKGIVVEQDTAAAVEHYRRAVEHGSKDARRSLDILHPRGHGI